MCRLVIARPDCCTSNTHGQVISLGAAVYGEITCHDKISGTDDISHTLGLLAPVTDHICDTLCRCVMRLRSLIIAFRPPVHEAACTLEAGRFHSMGTCIKSARRGSTGSHLVVWSSAMRYGTLASAALATDTYTRSESSSMALRYSFLYLASRPALQACRH